MAIFLIRNLGLKVRGEKNFWGREEELVKIGPKIEKRVKIVGDKNYESINGVIKSVDKEYF